MNKSCSLCTFTKNFTVNWLILYPHNKIIRPLYTFIFARPSMQFFNNLVLNLALHGRGYNNCCDSKTSGEEIFFQILSRYNPKLCIDIGANKGDYSEKILSMTNSDVIAFEPLPKAYSTLVKLSEKFPNRLTTINEGVGSERAELDLHFGDDNSELASFSKEVKKIDFIASLNVNSIKTKVDTLDNFFIYSQFRDREIDLLKIDTEGFEYEVLFGAINTIKKCKPKFIQIEFNWHQLFRLHSLYSLAEFLPNYAAYQMLPYGKGLVLRDLKSPESNIYRYSNFVFIREGVLI
jgi:FkbM family methyltransferase